MNFGFLCFCDILENMESDTENDKEEEEDKEEDIGDKNEDKGTNKVKIKAQGMYCIYGQNIHTRRD